MQRLWGVAVCAGCGSTIALGETATGACGPGAAGLCATCAGSPAPASVLEKAEDAVSRIGVAPSGPVGSGDHEREAAA